MLCILQARMSSSRLPGKMMMELNGEKLLQRVVDRVSKSKKVSKVIVATSLHQSDDTLVDVCQNSGIDFYRGSLENVAERFLQVAENERVRSFVRINGDSPLMDPALIDRAIEYFELGDCDLVTNVLNRTFPKGQSVEVVLTETLRKIINTSTDEQCEHVTKYCYDHPELFRIVSFTSGGNYNSLNMSIDTFEDKLKMENALGLLGEDLGGWESLTEIYQRI